MLDFTPLEAMPLYNDCISLVSGLGYSIVESKMTHTKSQYHIRVVINHGDVAKSVGIDDCAKVHRSLLPRLEAILKTQEVFIEVTSPGAERLIKNAAEIPLFAGRNIRLWDTEKSDWVCGKIITCTKESVVIEENNVELIIPLTKIAKAKLINL
ncbi:MAG: ribosome maturation factor [Treponemataceae bacterium]